MARTTGRVPDAVRNLLPRLRDPEFSKVVIVTLPEAELLLRRAREDVDGVGRPVEDPDQDLGIVEDVLDLLEEATDRCEDCANVLEGVVVKHG